METYIIYLIMILDNIRSGLIAMVMASVIICIGSFMACLMEDTKVNIRNKLFKICGVCFICAVIGLAFIPKTKQALIIAGVSVISNIDDIEKLPTKSVQALNKLLDDYLTENKKGE